ncbi:uncharacterized protein LOC123533426 [Mercenaria mercenaria]|uniref:uncharacterized protein LOC123533426 n=1 Tax=Mercenaria mercenaria TaxID=6596 RepID=UPI00234ECB14|nr:uncharacterized protein LOC123533426 [Mercenaria mercenaria]
MYWDVTGKEISFDPQSGKMIVPTKSSASDSPVRKLHKINTPSKSVHRQLYSQLEVDQEHVENLSSTEATDSDADLSELLDTTVLYSDSEPDIEEYELMENANDIPDDVMADTQTVQMVVQQLKTLLPSVTAHLADCGRLHEWMNFFHLIDSGDFSVKHIAAKLFLDVIKFSRLEDVRLMRYTPEVRQFWTVGQALFKYKFLRFMGGYNVFSGAIEHGDSDNKSMTKSDINMINFVCPNKDVLKEARKNYALDCSTPGIIHSNTHKDLYKIMN